MQGDSIGKKSAWISQLKTALDNNELYLVYQPKADAQTGSLCGFEALLRWNRKRGPSIGPAEFVPVAESSGLIHSIGDWLLKEACLFSALLTAQNISRVPVAVNVSMAQLCRSDFADSVNMTLRETKLAPQQLELELTESMMLEKLPRIIDTLTALRAIGLKISIDDFGTGYSNLSYLKQLPIDKIKIDRSFITNITHNHQDVTIVLTMIALAHKMRIGVVAEGVETKAQAQFLRKNFCDELQGYYISKPLSKNEFIDYVKRDQPTGLLCDPDDPRTLLLVDDEPGVLEALSRELRYEGYNVLKARSANEAMAIMAQTSVQVIVCDQRMPDVSGIELLSRIKDLYPQTVRIVLSGATELSVVTEAINRGAIYRYVTKPWDDEQLRTHIRESFSQHQLNQFVQ